jgi:hypothetical protein
MRLDAARILELGPIFQSPARAPDAFAAGVYNVGEASSPTISERLAGLPPSTMELVLTGHSISRRTSPSTLAGYAPNWAIAISLLRNRTFFGHRGWRKLVHLCNRKPYEPRAELRLPDFARATRQFKREDATPKRLVALAISWAAYTPLGDVYLIRDSL